MKFLLSNYPKNSPLEHKVKTAKSSETAESSETATLTDASSFSEDDTIADELFPSSPHRRRVEFSNICIREYQQTLGDNPAVSSGPPISLDWDYDPNEQVVSVEEYEEKKNECEQKRQLRALSRFKREKILEEDLGITRLEMKASIREVANIQQMRKISCENQGSEKFDQRMETFSRKLTATLRLRKNEKKELEKLMKASAKANVSYSQ